MKFTLLIASVAAIKISGDGGVIDALSSAPCEPRLWINRDEMVWQMDQFSRKFDVKNLNNALEIAGKIGSAPPKIGAWELNDKAFSFPRVRNYDFVKNNMDMLEHFQDNLNTNVSNKINIQRFIDTGKKVVANFTEKYHDGEYSDPASFDPRAK